MKNWRKSVCAGISARGNMNLKIRDNLLKYGMHALNMMGMLRVRKLSEIDIKKSSGILVVVTTALGDAIFCTPLFREIRRALPGVKVGVLVHAAFQDIMTDDRNIDVVVPYYGKFKKALVTCRRLKAGKFDIALAANLNDPDVMPLIYWSGIRTIIRRPWKASEYPYLVVNPEMLRGGEPPGHAVPLNLRMLEMLGLKPADNRTCVNINPEAAGRVDALFRERGLEGATRLIVFHPGASIVSKMWPAERYAELGRAILADFPGAKIVITGSAAEKKVCGAVAYGTGPSSVDLSGELSLRELAALTGKADLFVSGDTGPFHIANAQGIKTVTIYGPSEYGTNGPIWDLDIHKIVTGRIECYHDSCARRCRTPKCMTSIPVEAVLTECLQLLNLKRDGRIQA